MSQIEDPFWITVDDLSDHPHIWAICDRCDAEGLITAADPELCELYKVFVDRHQNCL